MGLSKRQERDIEKLMYRIKEAKNSNALGEEQIKNRTKELYKYLEAEGIVLPKDE